MSKESVNEALEGRKLLEAAFKMVSDGIKSGKIESDPESLNNSVEVYWVQKGIKFRFEEQVEGEREANFPRFDVTVKGEDLQIDPSLDFVFLKGVKTLSDFKKKMAL